MDICGCHLRCSNYRIHCSECRHQQVTKNKNFLNDMLGVWPNGNEAVYDAESAQLQNVNGIVGGASIVS